MKIRKDNIQFQMSTLYTAANEMTASLKLRSNTVTEFFVYSCVPTTVYNL